MEMAIFIDCKTLIERFATAGNCSFTSFCAKWKEMKFQHIFSAQSSNVELLQTTAAIMHAVKRMACGRCTNNTSSQHLWADEQDKQSLYRGGAIFLLYTVFFKQPLERYVKAEVSLETWREMKTFIDTLPLTPEWDDVRFCFWQLFQADALRFTALDYSVGLEELVDYDKVDEGLSLHCDEAKLKHELPGYINTQKMLPALSVLEDGYNEMKELLASTENEMNATALPPTTIFNSISETFQNIAKILEPAPSRQAKKNEAESQRRKLKRKGYRTNASENEEDTEGHPGAEMQKSKTKHYKRMSARTVFAEDLTAELCADLQDNANNENELGEGEDAEEEADATR